MADFPTAIRIAETGLRVDPNDDLLANNLIVALARNGDVTKVVDTLRYLTALKRTRVRDFVFTATRGLVAFVAGNQSAGRNDYMEAMRLAPDKVTKLGVLASWGETEARHNTPFADLIKERILLVRDKVQDPTTLAMIGSFDKAYIASRASPLRPGEMGAAIPALSLPALISEDR
jgi:hypothetical protein